MSRGDVCKVCDRKFFIKEMIKEKEVTVEAQYEQLIGTHGLNAQIEGKRKEIKKVQKEHQKTKDMYRLDYQKMQIVLGRLKDNATTLKNDSQRKQNSNDELVDKIH